MHLRILLLVATIATCSGIVNSESMPTVSVEEERSNHTQNAANGDKLFWEWLYGLVAGKHTTPSPVTEPPKPEEPESCSPCTCGITNKQNRIVGGVETQVNQYPWMALLTYRGRFYCGATVITSSHVLTAAHCIDRFDPNLIRVRIMEHNRNSSTETDVQEFKVMRLIKHSGYSTANYNNDIALIKLAKPIKFEGKMRPACLPERGKTFAGMDGIATGWGAIEESGPISQTLQEVVVPILSNTECRASKYPERRITDNMICAGYKEGQKDSCQGDSGGPLHIVNDNVHHVVGVVSWGEGCAKPNYPGVYTRVNRYLTWIKRNTMNACYC